MNNVIEAYDDPAYGAIMEAADLVTPDRMLLVWGLCLLGVPAATRVYGPDLTPAVCQPAAEAGIPVGFHGGAQDVLEELTAKLPRRFPGVKVAYRASPPFRSLTSDEERRALEDLDRSSARILFVGLGAPKQERWMAAHKHKVNAVMLGSRGSVRLPGGQETTGTQARPATRPRMAVPPGARASAVVAAVSVPEPPVRHPLRRTAAERTTP